MIIEWLQFLENGLPLGQKQASVTIGVFDGVHLGHKALIKCVVSHNPDYVPVVFTFTESHKEENGAGNIQTFRQKAETLKSLGVETLVVINFDESFRHIPGIEFLEILLKRVNIGFFAVGSDFRCGYRQDTDAAAIREFFVCRNIPVEIVPEVMEGSLPISSSRIRAALAAGDYSEAETMLNGRRRCEERGLSQKDVLQKAQKTKNDEFYTRYEDVEKEVSMYSKSIWKNKTVFCNCDDVVGDEEGNISAFSLYFIRKFNELGLKKLICTHYNGVVNLFNQNAKIYIFTKDGYEEFKEYPEGYNGSFEHPLSLKILKEETDIVCTNPPFSKAADYWKVIIESGKKFLIISNITNPITPAFIRYFKDNQVWAGFNRVDYFLNPKKELVEAAGHWYTNFPIKNRPKYKHLKFVPLKDIPEKYKKYDDSKKLVVNNCYIPNDYKKPFAVSARPILNGLLEKGYKIIQETQYFPYVNGKKCFGRILVQKFLKKLAGKKNQEKNIV